MPRIANASVPKYRKHRPTGQAVVTIGGADHYLGPHGTKTSRIEYDRLIAEWMANGRQPTVTSEAGMTVAELMRRYRQHVIVHYVKNGRSTSEQHDIAVAMRFVRLLYAQVPVAEFGPPALKAVRQKMIEDGYCRKTINQSVHRIRRMFRWGTESELIRPSVLQALEAVTALAKGKFKAHETEPVGPVADEVVEATLPHLPAVIADMVQFQRLTGCRPQEVCLVRVRQAGNRPFRDPDADGRRLRASLWDVQRQKRSFGSRMRCFEDGGLQNSLVAAMPALTLMCLADFKSLSIRNQAFAKLGIIHVLHRYVVVNGNRCSRAGALAKNHKHGLHADGAIGDVRTGDADRDQQIIALGWLRN